MFLCHVVTNWILNTFIRYFQIGCLSTLSITDCNKPYWLRGVHCNKLITTNMRETKKRSLNIVRIPCLPSLLVVKFVIKYILKCCASGLMFPSKVAPKL